MKYFFMYWDGLLGVPLRLLESWFGLDVYTPWKATAWRAGFTVALLVAIYEIYLFLRTSRRKYRERKEMTPVGAAQTSLEGDDDEFVKSLDAMQAPEQTIAMLKREKRWDRLGTVYAALNRHKEAAGAYKKAGDLQRAGMAWAKAGKTLRAARMLERAGDFGTAARFYSEKDKHAKAAKAYSRQGDVPNAAAALLEAKKPIEAADTFAQYFRTSQDPAEQQVQAADLCHRLLQDETAKEKVDPALLKTLGRAVAARFAQAERYDIAARLFQENGDPGSAGEVLLKVGNLEAAAKCMQAAGRTKEAAEIGARYYESRELWKEAGMAYEGAGSYQRAGDCFSKANDAGRAAQCYQKANEFFGAGFALVHVKEWEPAITMFQKLKEDHPRYAESRALLGRCFYELQAYEHCAAALDNHLTGARVTSDNVDYFWMLALAYEQIGELPKSKEILLKIRTVNVGFRDVGERLSNIETRISMLGSKVQGDYAQTPAPQSQQPTAVMDMIENSIGPRYKLESELGRGGMGVVYLAKDTQLDRKVALKFLGALVDESDEYKARFIREAKAAAKVTHPNIVSIYDIGTQEGKAYIAMEFIEGSNLHRYLTKKGKLGVREAINIVCQALAALDSVHDAGIVHRDIKPDNIVVTRGGLVKLMDFGLAKAEGMRLTATGVVMGTPCYMAPEQVRGEDASPATDLYAMGLVLHELLTGETVFADGDVLDRQLNEMPKPPGEIVEDVPKLLDQIIIKAVAKEPAERFESAREFHDYLRNVASG